MCYKNNPRKIDDCMLSLLNVIHSTNKETFACCCGHLKYHQTIVMKLLDGTVYEFNSRVFIPRKKRFYVKDKQGFYFIPEVEKYWREK